MDEAEDPLVKNEEEYEIVEGDLETIKIEGHDVQTVILQNLEAYNNEEEGVPIILNQYTDSDGNIQMAQVAEVEDGDYAYIIEEEEESFPAAGHTYVIQGEDEEHYIIEEYQGNYDSSQDTTYETYDLNNGTTLTIQEETPDQELENEDEEQEYLHEEYLPQTPEEQPQNEEEDSQEGQQVFVQYGNNRVIIAEEYVHDDPDNVFVEEEENEEEQRGNEEEQVEMPKERVQIEHVILNEMEQDAMEEEDIVEHDVEEEEMTDVKNEAMERDKSPILMVKIERDDSEDETAQCDKCDKKFKTTKGLKRHITTQHNESTEDEDPLTFQTCPCCGEPKDSAHTIGEVECPECPALFYCNDSLARHTSVEHNKTGEYRCNECSKKFEDKQQLLEHLRVHLLKCVKCEGCERLFTRKYHLDRHVTQTGCGGAAKDAFQCRVCKRYFTRKDNLADHLKSHAGISKKKKLFICQYCKKQFQSAAMLQIHLRTHTGEKPYKCDLCPKSFPSSGSMKKHRRKHTGEKPYSCHLCDRKFAAKETLNRHIKTHTGVKPHTCKFCGKSFIQAAQLRAHVFHHTGENAYTCEHCGRAFNRRLRLTTHIKFMHKGEQPLICEHEGCNRPFFRREDLQRHMQIHSGEKPFMCEICQKRFTVKSSLKMHMFTHRKEPPVSCETCGRAFIRQDCLMRHVRARHRDVLEDVMISAEKKKLQEQLLSVATDSRLRASLNDNTVWNELTLTESVKELLSLLVDEECLQEFGFPESPVDKVLDQVIKRCGYIPTTGDEHDYLSRLRENAKLLFTVVIDDEAVKELLNNQTVDEVILHVLRLARKQQ